MSRVSTYLNFTDDTERAFEFYRSVFGGEFKGPIHRFSDVPPQPGGPPITDDVKNLIMHIELPILGGHVLMGTDLPSHLVSRFNAGIMFTLIWSLTREKKPDACLMVFLQAALLRWRCRTCSGAPITGVSRTNSAFTG